MRYASHLYLRTDGTLGRFPIIEVDDNGVILSVRECVDTLVEMPSTRFFAGVIVPGFVACGAAAPHLGYIHASHLVGDNAPLAFASADDFCRKVMAITAERAESAGVYPAVGSIQVGSCPGLLLVSGFGLGDFCSSNPTIRRLV